MTKKTMKSPKYIYYCTHCKVSFPYKTVIGSKCQIIKYVQEKKIIKHVRVQDSKKVKLPKNWGKIMNIRKNGYGGLMK